MAAPDADRFDRLAPTYDQAVPFFATFGARLVQWAGVQPGQRVLDLGAGRGAVSVALSRSFGAAIAIVAGDVSAKMRAELAAMGLPGVEVKPLDATAIDEPDSSFDVVFSAFVFHFLADRHKAMAEVARVLRPGASFVLSVPAPAMQEGWWASYRELLRPFRERARQPGPAPDAPAYDALADAAGLCVVETTTVEIALALTGPEQHWEWLLAHSHRGLYDALAPADQHELHERVLDSLRTAHPFGGRRLLAAAVFSQMAHRRP